MLGTAQPAGAVTPAEMLDDPALEARAREIGGELRCLVCRNESIEESDADLASDLRILVRERVTAGDSNAEVIDYVTDRYGEYVLLRPNARGANLILWLAGPVMLLGALGLTLVYLRRRAARPEPEALTEDETARLRDLMRD
ncbi:cytochrome c-type biogenesis protein [Mesobaculum littorinae]|nr:cytochrome c-type biogenesis protein [Mesobaculum littorinae]